MEEKKKQESDKKEQQKQQYFAAQKQQLRTAKEMLGESAVAKGRLGLPETKHSRQATMGQMRVHDQILGGDPLHPPGW